MAYATVEDALQLAGVEVTEEQIALAQTIIELYTNRTEAGTVNASDRDLYWLKLATCYQAAYMISHPDVLSLMEVESYSQGDISVKFRGSGDTAVMGPLTKKALSRVSWNRNRSIMVKSDFITDTDLGEDKDLGSNVGWTPF